MYSFWDREFCTDSLQYYHIPGLPHPIGILMVLYGGIHIVMSLITVIWIKSKEREAQAEHGKEDAAKSVIFPVFVNFLWLSIAVNIMAGLIVVLFPLDPINHNNTTTALLYSFMWSAQHVVIEGIAFLLMQKGCGKHASNRAATLALIWGTLTFLVMYYIFTVNEIIGGVITILWDTIIMTFYLCLWTVPDEMLFRRPAAIMYAKFWVYYRALTITINILVFFRETEDFASCGIIIVQIALFAILQPLVCYWTLLKDSRWWQGLDFNDAHTEQHDTIRAPLLGSDFSLSTAQSLADTMDRMRSQAQVKMLNFACIKVDFNKPLGSGSFSKVYKGSYRGKDCAIKLIYTVDLTADVIQRVAAEASILSAMRHPNIVNILGVSVLPPSVCLILELCSFGSLSDIIRGYGFDWNMSHRNPLRLNRVDILHLALGCARGIAAIHSYDSSVCHRDVKSFNFLVDHQFTVKIADLELGTTKDKLHTNNRGKSTASNNNNRSTSRWSFLSRQSTEYSPLAQHPHSDPFDLEDGNHTTGIDRQLSTSTTTTISADPSGIVVVEDLLANWMAPEVIRNRKFQQASDIFSLGTVLWEIVSQQLPFENMTQIEIRRLLLSGYRHPIPECERNTVLSDLIKNCWEDDPSLRPTALEIVRVLERTIEEYPLQYLRNMNVDSIPDCESVREYYMRFYKDSFPGVFSGLTGSTSATTIDFETALYDSFYEQAHQTRRWAGGGGNGKHGGISYQRRRKKRNVGMNGYGLWNMITSPFQWLFSGNNSSQYGYRYNQRRNGPPTSLSHFNDDPRFHSLNSSVHGSSSVGTGLDPSSTVNGDDSIGYRGNGNTTRSRAESELSSVLSSEFSDFINDSNGEDLDNDDRMAILSTRLSSGNLSTRIKLQAQMPKSAHDAIRLVKQEKFWAYLEQTDQAWAVMTIDYPHVVLHATSRWYEMFEVPSSFGSDYHLLSLLGLITPEMEAPRRFSSYSNHYVHRIMQERGGYRRARASSADEIFAKLRAFQVVHGILNLHVPSAISRYHHSVSTASRHKSNSTGGGLAHHGHSMDGVGSHGAPSTSKHRCYGHNLMCSIHAYPVYPPTPFNYEEVNNSSKKVSKPSTTATAATIDGVDEVEDDEDKDLFPEQSLPVDPELVPEIEPVTTMRPPTLTPSKSTSSFKQFFDRNKSHDERNGGGGFLGSLSPLRSFSTNNKANKSVPGQKMPMYYVVLFNELREQHPDRRDENDEDQPTNRNQLFGSGRGGQSSDKQRNHSTASKILGGIFGGGNNQEDEDDYDEYEDISDDEL